MATSRLSLAGILIVASLLGGCTKNGTPMEVADARDDFEVTKLFVKDNCVVYRFYDGRYHYFTNCSGTTMTTQSYQCGKTRCSYPEEIAGK